MTIIIIIIAIAGFLFYNFNNDRKDEKRKVLKSGGMQTIYPKFGLYINQANNTNISFLNFNTTSFELVRNDDEYLEYKFPVLINNNIIGYYHIGIQHSFITSAYCYSINANGQKIEGFVKEIHNGKSISYTRDREIEDYRTIFNIIVTQMESVPNFEEKFYLSN